MCFYAAIFQIFIVSHISPSRGKTIYALLYQYVKCLLLRIYLRVGVNNITVICTLSYSNISNVYCFAYIPESGKTICAFYIHMSNVYYFGIHVHFHTAIFQMFVLHISPNRGKPYVHFCIHMSNVYYFAYIPVSG